MLPIIHKKHLRKLQNLEIQELCQFTKHKFIKEDVIANKTNNGKLSDRIVKQNIKKILGDINGLKEQKVILQAITQSCSCNALINGQMVCDYLPENIYVFVRRPLIFTLLINSNLLRSKNVDSALCNLCKTNNQTQLHMLNNCQAAVRSDRYIWGHNSILYTMCHYLSEFENAGLKLYTDVIGFKSPTKLFNIVQSL